MRRLLKDLQTHHPCHILLALEAPHDSNSHGMVESHVAITLPSSHVRFFHLYPSYRYLSYHFIYYNIIIHLQFLPLKSPSACDSP